VKYSLHEEKATLDLFIQLNVIDFYNRKNFVVNTNIAFIVNSKPFAIFEIGSKKTVLEFLFKTTLSISSNF